ncbi:MAG: polysaccharide biosynthesis protein [Candidatus Kapabacteria bacterium]|nr:polysaccharide biosynthesis protein [Candidatus Kapabacteria bacterium]
MSQIPLVTPSHSVRRLAGASVILAVSQIIGMMLNFLSVSTIQHVFSKADNGTFFWVQQLSGFAFIIIAEMGMHSVVMRLYVEASADRSAQDEILRSFFQLRFLLWLATSVVLLGVCLALEPQISVVMALYALYSLIAARSILLRTVLETRRRAQNHQLVPALAGLLDMALMSIFILADRENLTPLRVVVWFCLAALPGFILLLAIDGQWKLLLTKRFDTRVVKRLLYETMPIFVSLCLMQIQDKSDTFALNLLYGREVLGVYSAVMRITLPFVGLLMIISTVMAPPITQLRAIDNERCKVYVLEGLKLTLLAATACAVGIGSLAEGAIWATAGSQYLSFSLEFIVGAWSLVPSLCVAYLFSILVALGLNRTVLPMMLTLSVCAVLGNVVFTPNYGVLGAIAARITATMFAAGVGLVIVQKFMQNGALRTMLLRFAAFTCFMVLSLWGVLMLTPLVSIPLTVAIILRTLALVIVFVLGCLGTGLLRKDDIGLLLNVVKSSS